MYTEHVESQQKFLLVVIGPPGVGKTALAHELKKEIPCQIVSKDDIANHYLYSRNDEADYINRYRGYIYPQVYREVNRLLFSGPVVVDVTHRLEREKEGWESEYRRIADMHDVPLFCIELVTSQEILWQRLGRRPAPPAFYNISTEEGRLRFIQDWLTNPSKLPADCGLRIDNSGPLSVTVGKTLAFITH